MLGLQLLPKNSRLTRPSMETPPQSLMRMLLHRRSLLLMLLSSTKQSSRPTFMDAYLHCQALVHQRRAFH